MLPQQEQTYYINGKLYYQVNVYLFYHKIDLLCENFKSSPPEVFLGKGVPKISNKFTGEHPCRSAISKRLQSNFIEIAFRHVCSPVNLLHIFRTLFPKNTSGRLPLAVYRVSF